MPLRFVELRPLLEQSHGAGLLVSCYVDQASAAGAPVQWPGAFKAKATAVRKMLGDDAIAVQQFEKNFEAIGRSLEQPELASARGAAVFVAVQRGFSQSFALETPVEDELIVHRTPYLVPLLQTYCRQRQYLAVLTDTHRARLYEATAGGVRVLGEVEGDVPRRQHSAGERGGMEQATIAQHRQECILHFQKELVRHIEQTWSQQSFHGILLLGEHEVVEHVRKRLPARLAVAVVYEGPQAWPDNPLALGDSVSTIVTDLIRAQETRLLTQLQERRQQGYRIASGASAVIDALQSGKLTTGGHGYVVLGPDPRETVARCTACRSLFVDMPTNCPRCAGPCGEANLWEEVLLMALRHNITVYCPRDTDAVAHCEGIAAVLPDRPGAAVTLQHISEQSSV